MRRRQGADFRTAEMPEHVRIPNPLRGFPVSPRIPSVLRVILGRHQVAKSNPL
jgi:hypothetical protein